MFSSKKNGYFKLVVFMVYFSASLILVDALFTTDTIPEKAKNQTKNNSQGDDESTNTNNNSNKSGQHNNISNNNSSRLEGDSNDERSIPRLSSSSSLSSRRLISDLVQTHSKIISASDESNYEQTLLDIFGEVSKEFLTHNLIPPTDAECDWNWVHARCEPYCKCSLQYNFGDFHLGRSCRYRPVKNKRESTDDDSNDSTDTTIFFDNPIFDQVKQQEEDSDIFSSELLCVLPPNNKYTNTIKTAIDISQKTIHHSKRTMQEIKAKKLHLYVTQKFPELVQKKVRQQKQKVCDFTTNKVLSINHFHDVESLSSIAHFLCSTNDNQDGVDSNSTETTSVADTNSTEEQDK